MGEPSEDCASVPVTGGDPPPDGLEVLAAVLGDIDDPLPEVPVGVYAIPDSLDSEYGLVLILRDYGSELTEAYLLNPMNLALTHSLVGCPLLLCIFFLWAVLGCCWAVVYLLICGW